MSEIIRTSFYYDPIRQGYDTNSWRTLSGTPETVPGGRLMIDTGTAGSAIHYSDILKGDIRFNINVPSAPDVGSSTRIWGLYDAALSAYIRFRITGGDLECDTSDGVTTTWSSAITWDPSWTGNNIQYRIRWEAGTAKFFVNGSQVHAVSDASVPHGPLSLYLSDNSDTGMSIGDILVLGTMSLVVNPKTADTRIPSFSPSVSPSSSFSPSISASVSPSSSFSPSASPSLSASISLSLSRSFSPSISSSVSPSRSFSPSLSSSVSPSRSFSPSISASVSPSFSPSPSPSFSPSI